MGIGLVRELLKLDKLDKGVVVCIEKGSRIRKGREG